MKDINLKSGDYTIELNLRSDITIITGDTATGKTFLYNKIKDADNTEDIILINYDFVKTKGNYDAMVDCIKRSMNKLFVIDNADAIQRKDDTIMLAINNDLNNTFIVIGRHPELIYNISDMAEVNISDNKITLNYIFDEPLI
jgi:hypothetical protein